MTNSRLLKHCLIEINSSVALKYYIFRSFALIQEMRVSSTLLVVLIAFILSISAMIFSKSLTQTAYGQASISDGALNVEAAVEGLSSPTSMAF